MSGDDTGQQVDVAGEGTTAEAVTVARSRFESGHFEEALRLLLPDDMAPDREAIRLRADTLFKVGEIRLALGELNRLRSLWPSLDTDQETRHLLGRVIETDPRWLPSLDCEPPNNTSSVPRRILHVLKESLPHVETGFTIRSRTTLAAQTAAGYDPVVVTSVGFGADSNRLEEQVEGVTHHRLPSPADVSSLPFDVLVSLHARGAADVADRVRPALVQAGSGYRGFDAALVGLAVAERRHVPLIYEVRGFQEQTWTSSVSRSERGEYYRLRMRQEHRCMMRADHVITIAEAMAAEIVDRGIPAEKVSVIPNVVDTSRFAPRPKDERLSERYGLSGRFVVGYVSNLGAREGIDHLVRAISILQARGANIGGLIVGEGPERPFLERLVDDLGLGESVRLTGHVQNAQIEDHYALIDLFVVPRIDDRAARLVTPLKPLEAMAMERPVIVSALPALEELVDPGKRGLVFPPSDPAALADTIETLIRDGQLRARFAEAGGSWVRHHRSLTSNSSRYRAIVEPLLG